MSDGTKIEWTDHTFNPWMGCAKVSPGCKHCYAETLMDTRWGKVEWGVNGTRVRTSEANWKKPLAWNRRAEREGRRFRVFCASLADVFEDRRDLVDWRTDLFALIEATPNLDWQLLTKRPENVLWMAPMHWRRDFPPNVWIGTSVEDQERAGERIPHLLKIPAKVRFLSCEPLLGPVDYGRSSAWDVFEWYLGGIDWVIVGGESGPGARPCNVEWVRSIVRECKATDTPAFVKQLGANVRDRNDAGFTGDWCEGNAWDIEDLSRIDPHPDAELEEYQGAPVRIHLTDPKGGDPSEWPEDLRVREFPPEEL